MNQLPKPIVLIIIGTQCVLASGCVLSLCLSLFYKVYADPSILSAMILLTGTLVGNLSSLLGGPRAMMAAVVGKTEIVNSPEQPVQVATPQSPRNA